MTPPSPEPELANEPQQVPSAEQRLFALERRVEELERGASKRQVQRPGYLVALAVGTVVALGLPFLWDESSVIKEPIAVAGWRLFSYDQLFAFSQPVSLFPRLVPWLIVLAAIGTALARSPKFALLAAVLDGLLVLGCIGGSSLVRMNGHKLDSTAVQQIAGPGSGWWVSALLLVGWTLLAADGWIRRGGA